MTARTSTAIAYLLFAVAQALAVNDPVLSLRTELGGGDMNWSHAGVYAPDGKTLYAVAWGPNSGLVYVIDPAAGRKRATLKLDPLGAAARGQSTGHEISPDGKFLAVAYEVRDKDANAAVKEIGWEVVLWDLAAGKVAATARGARDRWQLNRLTFSPDGKTLAGTAAGYDTKANRYGAVVLTWGVPGLAQKHAFEVPLFTSSGLSSLGFAREAGADILRAVDWASIHR